MKLGEQAIQKADSMLKEFLLEAEGHEPVRAIMLLGDEETASGETEFSPKDFSTRAQYQQALVRQRQATLERTLGSIRRALEELQLTTRGGALSRSLVVEGTAEQILRSLELPSVRHASLDRPIKLVRPLEPDQDR